MIQRLAEEQRLSGAVVHGGLVWLAGQVADDTGLDAEGQTADVLRQVDALLGQAGTDKSRLLSVTVVLADIRDAPAMNRAWDRWLDPSAKPARMTVQAPLVDPAWRVEITGVAALPGPAGAEAGRSA
jgi:enamine deaminase RidA (YjgF/YER057c/UK114 family)